MLTVLRHPTYRLLWLSHASALLGTGIAAVALSLLAFRLAGERAGAVLGTLLAIKMVMYVVVAPLVSALHLPRPRTTMLTLDAIRIAAACALPWVSTTQQIYVLLAILYGATAAYTPTLQAVIPTVLTEERSYTQALALARLTSDVEAVASPTIAGVFLFFLAPPQLFWVTATTFAVSFFCLSAITLAVAPQAPPEGHYPDRLRRGLGTVVREPIVRGALGVNLAVAGAGSFILVLTVVVAKVVLRGDDTLMAILLACFGAGSIAAAVTLPRLVAARGDCGTMLTGLRVVCVGAALATVVVGVATPDPRGAVAVGLTWAVCGWGWCCALTPISKLIKDHVPPADWSGAFAAQFSLSHAAWLVMYPLIGWVGSVHLVGAAALSCVVTMAGTVTAWWLWRRSDPHRERAG